MNHHSSTSISCICLGAFFLFLSWWMSSNLVCSKHEQRRKRLLRFHCWLERAGGVFQVYRDNLPALGWRAWKLKTPRVSRVARCQQMQPGLFSLEKNIKITQIFNWFWVWFRCFAKCFILFYFFPGRVDLYIYKYTYIHISIIYQGGFFTFIITSTKVSTLCVQWTDRWGRESGRGSSMPLGVGM